MKNKNIFATALCAGILSLGLVAGRAQTTANWIGPASGDEWNTAADWDTALPPGADVNGTTNAFIGAGTNVSYNLPMSAAGFGSLTLNGVLNINNSGFNCSGIALMIPTGGDKLFVNNGGTVAVNGNVTMGTNANLTLAAGGSLTVGALTVAASTSSHAGGTSVMTNNGGIYNATSTTINNNGGTATGLVVINGGTNNLGNTFVGRCSAGSGGFSTLGNEGLIIYNGLVTMTNLNVGNGQSGFLSSLIAGGFVTNVGTVTINQGTTRASRLLQKGGLFVVPDPGVINPNSSAAAGDISIFAVTGGTNITGGFYFGNSNNAASTVNFTNSAVIYVGSQGINWNGAITLNASLNNGGLFGATAPWTGLAPMRLVSGTFIFQTADPNNNPNNITLSGALSGSGGLIVTGGGTLTLDAADTYSGNTVISAGTLALGSSGTVATPEILVGTGATFDVTALSGAYTLNANQTLAGFGAVAGAVTAAASSTIYPGSNTLTGTLTLSGGLTENGGVNNEFNLSSNPSGPNNDFLNATGGLTLSGTNIITILGALTGGDVYPLINYGGSLTGDVTNFSVVGAEGVLSNSTVAHAIYFIAQSSVRGPTNITWLGNVANNVWDTTTTNWLNTGTGALDFFIPNDNALFSDLGATNSVVNIPGSITPGSITINTTSNYVFTGNGAIAGVAILTVSNGMLTVLTTNTYTGQTIFDGGVLATPIIANSGSPSGIGSASSDPASLIFNGGAFFYFGDSAGIDHGMTLTNLGGTIDVTNGTTLTLNGTLTGNGSLTKIDDGALTLATGNSYTGNTILNAGTLTLNNAAAAGSGSIVLNGGNLALGAVKPANAINVTANSQVTGGNAGGLTGIKSVTGGSNLLLAVTPGVFDLTGDMSTYSGAITFSNAGGTSVRFNGSIGSPLATWDLGAGPTMDLMVRTSSSSNNIGALRGAGGTTLSGRGGASNNGSTTHYIGANGLDTTFDGIIQNGSGGSSSITSVNKVGSGTLALSGQNTYTGTTTISSGTLALVFNPTNGADGSINSSATINIVSGAVLDVSGRSDGTLQVGSTVAQTMEGRGTLLGSLNASGSATVSPGGGPGGNTGTLMVTNSVTLSGTAWMKLNRANTPNSDQIVSSLSTVTYGGTLTVTNIGARLQTGDRFTLFSGGGLSGGSFGTVNLPNYYTWDTSQLGVNGSIAVTAVLPPPAITNVDFSTLSSGTVTLNAANGAPNGPVIVLTTTNLALPVSTWTGVATNAFDSSGNLSLPITVNPALPQSYFLLQAY